MRKLRPKLPSVGESCCESLGSESTFQIGKNGHNEKACIMRAVGDGFCREVLVVADRGVLLCQKPLPKTFGMETACPCPTELRNNTRLRRMSCGLIILSYRSQYGRIYSIHFHRLLYMINPRPTRFLESRHVSIHMKHPTMLCCRDRSIYI